MCVAILAILLQNSVFQGPYIPWFPVSSFAPFCHHSAPLLLSQWIFGRCLLYIYLHDSCSLTL